MNTRKLMQENKIKFDSVIEKIISKLSEKIENIILVGKNGVGKTTIVKKLLVNRNDIQILFVSPISDLKTTNVSQRLTSFCKKVLEKDKKQRIVIIDDTCHIPSATQQVIGTTMDKYPGTGFIFMCDTVSNISESIQSRCIIINVLQPTVKKIHSILSSVSINTNKPCSERLLGAISTMANGDIRLAISELRLHYGQESAPIYRELLEEVTNELVRLNTKNAFSLTDKAISLGYSEIDIVSDLFNIVKTKTINDDSSTLINIMQELGDCQAIMAKGATPCLQLKACLASITKKMN